MKKLLFFLAITISFIVHAQTKAWTLEECIEYALEHNSKRTIQESRNEIQRINYQESVAGFMPSLNASTGISLNFGRGLDPETNTYINKNTLSNSYDISSSMNLFNGFAQINRVKMAKINRLLGASQLQEAKDAIAFETMEIFFNVLYYKGTVELARQQLEESVASLKRIERMEELGLKSIPDLTEIQAKEAEDRYLLTKQKNLFEIEKIKLKEKMNFPFNEDININTEGDKMMIAKTIVNAFEVYQQALGILPKAINAEKTVEVYETDYKISKSSLYPRLSLGAGYGTGFSRLLDGTEYMTFEDQLKNRQGGHVGITLSVPIFNRLSNYSYVKRSKQQLNIVRTEREETLRELYGEIEKTITDINGLADEYHHAVKRTESMESAHKVNIRKYEEGLLSSIELTTSSNRLLQSRVEELYTILKYQLKYQLLEYYQGNSFYTAESTI